MVNNNQDNNNITIYKSTDGTLSFNVNVFEETVWLTQKQMGELFGVETNTINYHVKEIYKTKELYQDGTIRKIRIVQNEGSRQVERDIEHYNLDAIISVGYRVNSQRATEFRKWATSILKQYLLNGYAINEKRVRQIVDERITELRAELKGDFKEEVSKIYEQILQIANRPVNIYNQISLTTPKLEEKIIELLDKLIGETKEDSSITRQLIQTKDAIKTNPKDKKAKEKISNFFTELGDETSKLNKSIKGIKKAGKALKELIKLWDKFRDML